VKRKRTNLHRLGGLVLGSLVEGTGGVALETSELVLGSLLGTLLGAGALLVGVVGGGQIAAWRPAAQARGTDDRRWGQTLL
jgi:hypothetical protein